MTGIMLIGTGVLFLVEPFIGIVSPATYRAVNAARETRRVAVLWPAGTVVGGWGVVLIIFSVPPSDAASWVLALLGVPFIAKGAATLLWAPKLAAASRRLIARPAVWRSRCLAAAGMGLALVAWGLVLLA